jgi:hypothetical protein
MGCKHRCDIHLLLRMSRHRGWRDGLHHKIRHEIAPQPQNAGARIKPSVSRDVLCNTAMVEPTHGKSLQSLAEGIEFAEARGYGYGRNGATFYVRPLQPHVCVQCCRYRSVACFFYLNFARFSPFSFLNLSKTKLYEI